MLLRWRGEQVLTAPFFTNYPLVKIVNRRIASDATAVRLGLSDPTLSEGQLIRAMVAHPELIDGPLVVTVDDAVLARPPEKVFNIL